MGRHHQIALAWVDGQIAHRDGRDAGLDPRPLLAAVERAVEPPLGADEDELRVDGVLSHRVRVTFEHGVCERRERAAVVARHEHVRRHVTGHVAVGGHEAGRRVVRRRRHVGDPRVRRQPGQVPGHVHPGLAAVASDLQLAVIRARPHHVRVLRRLADRVDRAVVLGRRVVDRQTAGLVLLQLRGVVRRQVRGDPLPVVAHVASAEQELCAHVEGAARPDVQGGVPVEAQLGVAGAAQRHDVLGLTGRHADARQMAALILAVDDVLVLGVRERPEAVAAQQGFPEPVRHPTRPRARSGPGAVVLQTAEDVVRHPRVHRDVVELPDRDVLARPPRVAAIERHVNAAVGAEHHELGVLGVDPERVHVAVERCATEAAAGGGGELVATVLAHRQPEAALVHAQEVLRVRHDVREVERTRGHVGVRVAAPRPVLTRVVAHVERVLLRLDDRVDAARARR